MKALIAKCYVMKIFFFFFFLSQNGIVTKDLTRLKMLFSEIEVSCFGCKAANVAAAFCPLFICHLVLVGFTDDGFMLGR